MMLGSSMKRAALRAGVRAAAGAGSRVSRVTRPAVATCSAQQQQQQQLELPQLQQRAFSGHGTLIHVPVPGNVGDESFDFTTDNYARVASIMAKYPENYKMSACIPLLDLAQRQNDNFLSMAAVKKVAQVLGANPMRVWEVATFYTMFNRTKVGKYFIQLCGTTPCMACGAQEIKTTIMDHLGIKDGETTKDGLFTLLEVECLGACANAPMVQINDDFYEMLTPKTTIELLEACKKGQAPPMTKWGSLPMNGQLSCEGPLGKTTLADPGAFKIEQFMRKDLEPKVDPASVKDHMNY